MKTTAAVWACAEAAVAVAVTPKPDGQDEAGGENCDTHRVSSFND
ncbi:hypothetical protein [Nonomuraea dietziae]